MSVDVQSGDVMAGVRIQDYTALSEEGQAIVERQAKTAILNKLIRDHYGPRFGLMRRVEDGNLIYEIKELPAA